MPSGSGEPATDDRGVASVPFKVLRKLVCCERAGVDITAGVADDSWVPFTVVGELPAAKSMTACWAVDSGSLGAPSYRSVERRTTVL